MNERIIAQPEPDHAAIGLTVANAIINAVKDYRLSCGCCRGPVDDRCCCWIHQDTPRGIRPRVCSRHQPKRAK